MYIKKYGEVFIKILKVKRYICTHIYFNIIYHNYIQIWNKNQKVAHRNETVAVGIFNYG